MDTTPSSSSSPSLRPPPPPVLRARSSSIALNPLAFAQLSTTRPRSNSALSPPGRAHQDEIGMGVTYAYADADAYAPVPTPPSEDEEFLSVALKEGYPLPGPGALALDIERPSSIYEAAITAVSSTRTRLGRLWRHRRQRSLAPGTLLLRSRRQSIPLDVLTPPPSPPPLMLDSTSLPLPASSPTTSAFALAPAPLTRARITQVVLLLAALFLLSTALLLALLYSLPVHLAAFPTTLADLAALGSQLRSYAYGYAESASAPASGAGQLWSSQLHVLTVLAYALLWSNAWSVPGSIVLNVLTGLLLPPVSAVLYLTALTAAGSVLATLLTLPAVPLLPSFSLSSSASTSTSTSTSTSAPPALLSLPKLSPTHLVLLRLSGVAPWSLLNIYAALHHTPVRTILWTCLVGCAPWCAVTAQVGSLLADIGAGAGGLGAASVGEVLRRPAVIGKLVSLSLLGGAPVLMKGWVKGWLSGAAGGEQGQGEEEGEGWRPRGWVTWSWTWSWRSWTGYKQVPSEER